MVGGERSKWLSEDGIHSTLLRNGSPDRKVLLAVYINSGNAQRYLKSTSWHSHHHFSRVVSKVEFWGKSYRSSNEVLRDTSTASIGLQATSYTSLLPLVLLELLYHNSSSLVENAISSASRLIFSARFHVTDRNATLRGKGHNVPLEETPSSVFRYWLYDLARLQAMSAFCAIFVETDIRDSGSQITESSIGVSSGNE
jgi:hypothetical protein